MLSEDNTQAQSATEVAQQPQQPSYQFSELLSEDLRAEPSLSSFKDVNSLAKSYVHAQKMIGGSLRIPAADASEEAKKSFYDKLADVPDVVRITDKEQVFKKLGKPESPDGYVVSIPEDFGDVDPEYITQARKIAFDMNLTQEQADKWVEFQLKRESDSLNGVYTPPEEAEKVLRKTWGEDYDNRLVGAKLAQQKLAEQFPEEAYKFFSGPLQNSPLLLDLLSKAGAGLREGGGIAGRPAVQYGLSPLDAEYKIAEKKSDKGFMKAYMDAKDPGHKQALKEMTDLYRKAYGG